jgi:glycosyltransferase involved in cell wall biosynthesis
MKKKILVCSESIKTHSGFGVYNKRLLESLHKSGKYELAEFASYGFIGDKEQQKIPWKYYPNHVVKEDPRSNEFNSVQENQFGRWRFDRVVLDFRPDIVIDVRDYWMSYFEGNSCLRKYFKWYLMPTVDSAPQKEEWLDTYLNADKIFTYSDWGRDVLNQQTSNQIRFADVVSPGVNLDEFTIEPNTADIKRALMIDPDSLIIGTVMRNQPRKLYPELIRAFEKIIERLDPSIADKTYLYFHTCYPDNGWDFVELIKGSSVADKIFFTYACRNCGAVFASLFSDCLQPCFKCKNKSAFTPNVSNGLDTSVLVKVINTFDIYVQYAICEGFGMPQIEAAACGLPIMSVEYSAMIDVINKLDATPIKVGAYYKELATSAIRVYPDEEDFIEKTIELLTLPASVRKKRGYESRELVKKHYNWDQIAEVWMKHIDAEESTQHLWNNSVPNIVPKIEKEALPKSDNILEILYFIQKNHLERINESITKYNLLKQVSYAQRGFIFDKLETRPFNLNTIIDNLNAQIENNNMAEMARVNPSILREEDYITYANK